MRMVCSIIFFLPPLTLNLLVRILFSQGISCLNTLNKNKVYLENIF